MSRLPLIATVRADAAAFLHLGQSPPMRTPPVSYQVRNSRHLKADKGDWNGKTVHSLAHHRVKPVGPNAVSPAKTDKVKVPACSRLLLVRVRHLHIRQRAAATHLGRSQAENMAAALLTLATWHYRAQGLTIEEYPVQENQDVACEENLAAQQSPADIGSRRIVLDARERSVRSSQ